MSLISKFYLVAGLVLLITGASIFLKKPETSPINSETKLSSSNSPRPPTPVYFPVPASDAQGPVFLDTRKAFQWPTGVDALNSIGEISKEAGVALNLTQDEIVRVNTAVAQFKHELAGHLRKLIVKNDKISDGATDVYTSEPFPDLFADVRRKLEGTIWEIIGHRKGTVLTAEFPWNSFYGHQGKNKIEYVFKEEKDALGSKYLSFSTSEFTSDGKFAGGSGGPYETFILMFGDVFEVAEGLPPAVK